MSMVSDTGNSAAFSRSFREAVEEFKFELKNQGRTLSMETHLETDIETGRPMVKLYGLVEEQDDDSNPVYMIYKTKLTESPNGTLIAESCDPTPVTRFPERGISRDSSEILDREEGQE